MRLTVLTYEYRPFLGGIGTYVAELCHAFHRAGHDVALIAPDYRSPSARAADSRAAAASGAAASTGIGDLASTSVHVVPAAPGREPYPVHRFPSGRGLGSWAQWFRNARIVAGMLREAGGDYLLLLDLHAFLLVGAMGIVSRGAVRLDRTAAVFHGSEIRYLQTGRRARLLGRPVVDRIPFLFTNSEWTRSLLESGGEASWYRKATVAGIGVSPWLAEARPGAEEVEALRRRWELGEKKVLLTVARLVPRKGIDRSLQAFAEVPAAVRADWFYLIAGDGPERHALEVRARELGIENEVRWLGPVVDDELPVLYDLADLYVQLSREVAGEVEGLGITFLEAGARGLACLACDHGGIPEAIMHEETGLLVPTDDPEAARGALSRLMMDPALRNRLGSAARSRIEREFRWDRVAERMVSRLGESTAGS